MVMSTRSRYRVKVVVDNHLGLNKPETKYVIQKRWGFWWEDEHDATANKEWAYNTCEEMNTDYETIRKQRK